MGSITTRHWDPTKRVSRASRPGDPPVQAFDSFIPHPLSGWSPSVDYELASAAASADRNCRAGPSWCPVTVGVRWLSSMVEAMASAAIEGIQPSPHDVAQSTRSTSSMEAAQVMACMSGTTSAVTAGRRSERMDLPDLLRLHRGIMVGDPEGGRLRTAQNWIGSFSPLRAVHVPPPHDWVPDLVEDLCEFAMDPSTSLLTRAATLHCQFETVHPFHDGNGRTGRALIHYVLAPLVPAVAEVLPVSLTLWHHRSQYYRALGESRVVCDRADGASRSQAMRPFMVMLVSAVLDALTVLSRLQDRVAGVMHVWVQNLTDAGARSDSLAFKALPLLVNRPVVSAVDLSHASGRDDRSARRAMSVLESAGVVRQITDGARNRIFEADAVVGILQDFR